LLFEKDGIEAMRLRPRIRKRQLLLGAALAVASVGLPIASGHIPLRSVDDGVVRTVVLTARGMKFNMTNPSIALVPGETVRVILRNEDPGMRHDLVIPEIGIRTPVLEAGEEAVLEFRAPQAGVFDYFCSMHPVSMQGVFRIDDTPAPELTELSE
jgi:plastocyanin